MEKGVKVQNNNNNNNLPTLLIYYPFKLDLTTV